MAKAAFALAVFVIRRSIERDVARAFCLYTSSVVSRDLKNPLSARLQLRLLRWARGAHSEETPKG
jgi:hypothetical protein